MDFYLKAARDYTALTDDEMTKLFDRINFIIDSKDCTESFWLSKNFYETKDIKGNIFCDLFNSSSDAARLLTSLICQQKTSPLDDSAVVNKEFAYVVFTEKEILDTSSVYVYYEEKHEGNEEMIPSDITKAYRFYLDVNCNDYKDFQTRSAKCFPDLFFVENAFDSIHKLGPYKSEKKELIKHLSVLNDAGHILYEKYSTPSVYDYLKAKWNIKSSGKGEIETNTFKLKLQHEGKEVTLNCQPHTKFYDGHNDQRIYFCWGHKDVCGGNVLIVVHIGEHL